jgi:signal transduction histidine kinase
MFMSPYSAGFMVKALVLMASGIYFLIRYHRKGPPFWIGLILVTTGFFDLRFWMEMWLEERQLSDAARAGIMIAIQLMFVGANTLYHYFVLIFYLKTAGITNRYLPYLLLAPLIITLVRTEYDPGWHFDFLLAAVWGSVYWLASLALAVAGMIRERERERIMYHIALALILLTNGFILIVAHFNGKEFVELVNMIWFTVFLAVCLLMLVWVHMKKMLIGMQRQAVVQKMDMGTALLHHSFKNAIGKVKINAWNIRRSLSKQKYDEVDQYVQNLFATCEHMLGMMAKVSQIVRDKLVIHPEQAELGELMDGALGVLDSVPGVKVVKRYEAATASLDKALVTECLINLIQNAVDAMQGEGTLTLSVKKQRRHVLISVTDTGVGMSKREMAQVFEPFYSTKGRTGKNMGLGMYYVQKVMEAHKGKVLLDSEAGKGTTVSLMFKRRRDLHGKMESAAG